MIAASGAASGSRAAAGFTFDPSTTLPWAVPLMLIAPLGALVLALSGVRTRRSASNMALFGAVVAFVATLLVAWGLAKKTVPFVSTYSYINLSVAFSGPVNFQGFVIDIVLRVDHLTVIAILVVEMCVIGALGWHRVMGRSEPGAARFHGLVSLFLFGCVGALVSTDLAELFAFWGLAGAATYLLLAHRWGDDEIARSTRVALALPFLTDLFLLSGISVLYSRYGAQNLNSLIPILHSSGWTVRSLVVASVLLFVGVAGRLALWPLQSWVTATAATAPPAASAMTQAAWSVLAIVVLYRVMPIFVASNPQTVRVGMYACAVAAVVAAILALLGNEPRRSFALLGSAMVAVGAAVVIHGFENQAFTFATAGITCVLAAAPARTAGILAVSAVAQAMRTENMAEMGDALRRMQASAIAILASGLVLGLSALGALTFAVASRSWLGVALGEAVLLVSLGSLRIFLSIAIGPLRRRRTFEPDRVREAPVASLGWPYWMALGGAVLVVASLARGWLDFLDGHKHPAPSGGTYVLWLVVALVGFAAAAIVYAYNKDGAVRASAGMGAWLGSVVAVGTAVIDRFVFAPVLDIAGRTGEWIPAGDSELGRAAIGSGRFALGAARAPVLPLVVLLAVLLALVVGLLSPGVFR
ncbi:MAG TPA: proton-conducting transporter membrane subunit [Candidatus Dormibacteraeota bacterium]|nr:proton-conducting transporter membrane subunit [Candidatus Dormibacteraeota bacterium]